MPRTKREKSEYGIYHVMLRGVNRQKIFEEEADNFVFLSIVETYKKKCKFELLAYCLMVNHVHLLIREGEMSLDAIFRRISTTYALYFNGKYARVGHLFQDRYRSEAIKSEAQFIQTLKYIHRNPVKAGMCAKAEEYALSSYRQYIFGEWGVADTSFVLKSYGRMRLIEDINEVDECTIMDIDDKAVKHISDGEARNLYNAVCRRLGVSNIRLLDVKVRNTTIRELKEAGLSTRQIVDLTGLNKTTVVRA